MVEHDGEDWGSPGEVAEQLGIRRALIYDWLRSGLLTATGHDPDVYRDPADHRRLWVRLSAAAAVERDTRHRGRPRRVAI